MLKRFILLLVAALVALPALSGCGYNQIQKNEEGVFAAWADVEATYQRRSDLIPNLVETVKAYASHEKETLQAVTEARTKAVSADGVVIVPDEPAGPPPAPVGPAPPRPAPGIPSASPACCGPCCKACP